MEVVDEIASYDLLARAEELKSSQPEWIKQLGGALCSMQGWGGTLDLMWETNLYASEKMMFIMCLFCTCVEMFLSSVPRFIFVVICYFLKRACPRTLFFFV